MSIDDDFTITSQCKNRIKEIEKCLEYLENCKDLYDNYERTKSDLEAHLQLLIDQLKYEVRF